MEKDDSVPDQGAPYVPLHHRLNADPGFMDNDTETANEIHSTCTADENSTESIASVKTRPDCSRLKNFGNVQTVENNMQSLSSQDKEVDNLTEGNRDKCREKDNVISSDDATSGNTDDASGDKGETDAVSGKTEERNETSCNHGNQKENGDLGEHFNVEEATEEADGASEESASDKEYESAEEGEEINLDQQQLRDLENELSDEQKEERRRSAAALKEEGNELFRTGSYKSAIIAYSRALRTCPIKFAWDRAILYSNKAACKMRLEMYEECIRDCTKAVELHPHYLKAIMRRAEIYEKTEKLDEALADYQRILELDPGQHTARAACMRLPDQIKERNEKLKTEMMGKLKELGNMVLRPFGLSTNNFQLNQDPNTGGYSVNFVQNPPQ